MKKAILTFGLFSLVVLTSFTTTETKTQSMIAETGDSDTGGTTNNGQTNSGQKIGGNKKLDFPTTNRETVSNSNIEFSNNLSFVETKKKSDI